MPFAISGDADPSENALENAEDLEVKAREKEGTIIVQTQLFVFTLDPDNGSFGYQTQSPAGIDGEIINGAFEEFVKGGVLESMPDVKSFHIAQNMPFTLPAENFNEYSDEGERRFMRVGGENVKTYQQEIGEFEIYAHSHGEENVDDVHPHEIIHRNPSDDPSEHLEELKSATAGMEISGIDFTGHEH